MKKLTKHEKEIRRLHDQLAREREEFRAAESRYQDDDRRLHAILHRTEKALEDNSVARVRLETDLKDARAQVSVCPKCDRYKSGTHDCYGCQADALTFFAAQLRSGILLALSVYERPTEWTLQRVNAAIEAQPTDSKALLTDAMETGKSMGGILTALRGLPIPKFDSDAHRSPDWIRQVVVGGLAGMGALAYCLGKFKRASKKPT